MRSAVNLVLTGMPGCGKSTIGALVAKLLDRSFVDTDALVVRKAAMSIPEIFERFGEARFRELERQVAEELSTCFELVIATGGGTIVQEGSPEIFRRNGVICYLRRPLDLLQTAHGRPLSQTKAAVKKLYELRREKYERASDFTVDNADAAPAAVARLVVDEFERHTKCGP